MPIVHTTYLERVDHPVGVFAARILAQLVLMLVLAQLVWLLLMLMVVQMVRLLLLQWWLILHNGLIPKINNLETKPEIGYPEIGGVWFLPPTFLVCRYNQGFPWYD